MKTRHIYAYAMTAAALALTGMLSCSDNYDTARVPTRSELDLKVDGHDKAFTVEYGAEPDNDIKVSVESNTLWKVGIECEGGWCTADRLTGRGSETFTLSILENIKKDRDATVLVYIVDSDGNRISEEGRTTSIQMTLRQAGSDVRLAPSSFEPFKARDNERQRMTVQSNVPWTLEVSYEEDDPSRFITITPADDSMTATGDGRFSGSGDASFDMTVADNGTAAERRAYINLKSVAATYSVEIIQNKSEYTFDVSAEKRTVEPQGGTLKFGVLSQSSWTVTSSDTSVQFSPASGAGNGTTETTTATFPPNLTDTVRTVQVRFKPDKENYLPQTVTVTQQPFTMTFAVSRVSFPGVIPEEGGVYTLSVSSMFDWEVARTPEWMAVTPESGVQSEGATTLSVRIDRNVNDRQREDVITVVPLRTSFHEGVIIDPASVGIVPVTVPVTQYGGQNPAISVPWVGDGFTQTSAELEFNYYSPFVEISSAGIEWRKESASSWESKEAAITDSRSGTVSLTLGGLDPATNYVARGYVRDSAGKTYYGSATYPFTTAGRYPGGDDNPTPSK